MAGDAPTVVCPHCGAQNPKSPLVPTCEKCLGSLEGAQPTAGSSTEGGSAEPLPAPADVPGGPGAPRGRLNLPTLRAIRRELARQWSGRSDDETPDAGPSKARTIVAALGLVCLVLIVATGPWWLVVAFAGIAVVATSGPMVARAVAAVSTYEATADPQPQAVPLGSSITWGVTVDARKSFDLGPGRIVLKCREHAARVGGRNGGRYRHTIHEESRPFAGRHLEAGETAELRAGLSIPASAIPSYEGDYNRFEWLLSVEASVRGICPNIKEQAKLDVQPWIAAGGAHVSEQGASVPANWLDKAAGEVEPGAVREGPLSAKLSPADGDESGAVPAVRVGSSRQLNLTLQAIEDVDCRAICYRILCRMHGRGNADEIDVAAAGVPVHEGALLAGQTVNCPIAVSIPAKGPVSYRGRYINVDWVVQVHVDVPRWFDRDLEVPFVVTPGLGPSAGAAVLR